MLGPVVSAKVMSNVFEVVAYDGTRIRLTEAQWLHMVFFHPEMEGEQEKMKEVLRSPEVVVQGATVDTRVCYKFYPSTPVASKYLAVVIKVLNGEGFIITGYFTERVRRGKALWRKARS